MEPTMAQTRSLCSVTVLSPRRDLLHHRPSLSESRDPAL